MARDIDKEREQMRSTLKRGPFSGPARVPGETGENPYAGSADSLQRLAAKTRESFSTPRRAGATVRKGVANYYGATGNLMKQGIGLANAPLRTIDSEVVGPLTDFGRGLITGDPGQLPPAKSGNQGDVMPPLRAAGRKPMDPYSVNAMGALDNLEAAPASTTGDSLPPARVADRMPQNDDPIAKRFLATESAPRSLGGLDVKHTKPVQGLDGVGYAGRYGETDVFRGTGKHGEASFSDLNNLAATRGGNPAELPEAKPGQPVIGTGDSTIDLKSANAEMRKANAVRQGSIDKRSFRDLQSRARESRPAEVYATELGNETAKQELAYDRASQMYEMNRDAQSDARETQKTKANTAKQAFDILKGSIPELKTMDASVLQQYEGLIGSIVQDHPNLLPDQVVKEARRRLANPTAQYSDEELAEGDALIDA